jgi:membrane protein YqaA with SNARE-associated domain
VSGLIHHVFRFFLHLGYLGPFVLGVFDSSFLFFPFGNDLLVVVLAARHHNLYLIYAFAAAFGSTLGVLLLDLVARRLGEEGVTRVAGQRRFESLKRKVSEHGTKALVIGSLAPPPFPFTMVVAANSALGFPRSRLLLTIATVRALRFLILGALAIKFGRSIIHVVDSPVFKYFMYVFTAICLLGSGFSLSQWIRKGRSGASRAPSPTPAKA